jgi:hypothetical protein
MMTKPVLANVLLLGFLSIAISEDSAGQVAERVGNAISGENKSDYDAMFSTCGRGSSSSVYFFTAFDGLWPVPSNFVLVDAADRQLEFTDQAAPWDNILSSSILFYGPREVMENRWRSLLSLHGKRERDVCKLSIESYDSAPQFEKPVAVVSSDKEILVMVGTISKSAKAALECYTKTVYRVGSPCG